MSNETQDRPRLGYIGLGIMGGAMAANLLEAGYALSVWNRTAAPGSPGSPGTQKRCDALVKAGAVLCESPAKVAEQSDVVFLNVTDTPDVEQVLFSVMGVAAGADEDGGLVVVDHSTISPVATREFAKRLEAYKVTLMDAPVSGGDVGATNGTLSIMAGGPPEVFAEVLPMLEVVGETVTHVGAVGNGQACKACNQVAVLGALTGAVEAMALAKKTRAGPGGDGGGRGGGRGGFVAAGEPWAEDPGGG